MPKVVGQRSCVVAIVGQLVPRRMPQHVWVHWKRKARSPSGPLDHAQEPSRGDRCPSLSHEDVGARPLQRPQRPQLGTTKRMHTLDPTLCPVHMQAAMPKIDLAPLQGAKLSCTQSM